MKTPTPVVQSLGRVTFWTGRASLTERRALEGSIMRVGTAYYVMLTESPPIFL